LRQNIFWRVEKFLSTIIGPVAEQKALTELMRFSQFQFVFKTSMV